MKARNTAQPEQMQQLLNTEEEDKSLQLFAGEMYKSIIKIGSEETILS